MAAELDFEGLSHDLRKMAHACVQRGAEVAVEAIRPFTEHDAHALIKVLESQRNRLLNEPSLSARYLDPPATQSDQWFASRLAIVAVLHKPSFAERNVFVSISHSAGLAVAVACEIQPFLDGIGIDIENVDRPISKEVRKRIRSAMRGSNESELKRWARYEAAYKADPASATTSLSAYRFQAPDRFVRSGAILKTVVREFPNFGIVASVAGCWGDQSTP